MHPNVKQALHQPVLAVAIAAGLALSGCKQLGLADTSDNYSRTTLKDGTAILTGADLRLVTERQVTADGQLQGRVQIEKIVCAEPSPDVAKALSDSLSGAFQAAAQTKGVQASLDASLSLATAESIAQLGERLATIQLLRDEFADLCRSFGNGAVSATTYTLRLAKLDRKMVTLLLGEMAAGSFGRNLASIAGSATSSVTTVGSAADIKSAQDDLQIAQGDVASKEKAQKAAQDKFDSEKSDADKATADKADLDAKTNDLSAARKTEAQAAEKLASLRTLLPSSGTGGSVQQVGGIPGRADLTGVVAGSLVNLQRQYFEDTNADVLLAACIEATDLSATRKKTVAEVRKSLDSANDNLRKSETTQAAKDVNRAIESLGLVKKLAINPLPPTSTDAEVKTAVTKVAEETPASDNPFANFCERTMLDKFGSFMDNRSKSQNKAIENSSHVADVVLRQTQLDYCKTIGIAFNALADKDKTDEKNAIRVANDACLKVAPALVATSPGGV
jgi:hypothetical protein